MEPQVSAPAPRRRPFGVSIVCAFWSILSLVSIYFGATSLGIDFATFYVLATPTAGLNPQQLVILDWLKIGLPVDTVFHLSVILLGFASLFAVYGLWTAKRWSYKTSIIVLAVSAMSWVLVTIFYAAAPPVIHLTNTLLYGEMVESLVMVAVVWSYINRRHVREYLGMAVGESKISTADDAPSASI